MCDGAMVPAQSESRLGCAARRGPCRPGGSHARRVPGPGGDRDSESDSPGIMMVQGPAGAVAAAARGLGSGAPTRSRGLGSSVPESVGPQALGLTYLRRPSVKTRRTVTRYVPLVLVSHLTATPQLGPLACSVGTLLLLRIRRRGLRRGVVGQFSFSSESVSVHTASVYVH
jgi:hypothetical protein